MLPTRNIKKVIIIKNKRGITLIALVLTIVVMLILVTISVRTGIGTIEHSRMVSFVSRMQLLQKKVDFLAENEGYSELGTALTEDQKTTFENIKTAENLNAIQENTSLRYFEKSAISSQLEIDSIDDEIIVDFETREVISLTGIEYDGNMHYTQYNLPGGQKINQQNNSNDRSFIWKNEETVDGAEITTSINGLNATFKIRGINLTNGTISYSSNNGQTWTEITNYTIAGEDIVTKNITKSGTYYFKWVDNTNNNIVISNPIALMLTNSPQLKGNVGELSPSYNYSNLDSTNWAYATDSVTGYKYVWIPRFAYETESTPKNIVFLRGTSLVTTSENYLPETGWTIPEPLKNVTGVWVKVSNAPIANLDIIDILNNADIL